MAAAGLAAGPARRARQMLYAAIEGESAGPAERQSLRWMWNELEYGGNFFGDVPDGGYRRLVDAMAAGVDLRLGVEVAEVVISAGGVRVLATGRYVRGRLARGGGGAAGRAQTGRTAVLARAAA